MKKIIALLTLCILAVIIYDNVTHHKETKTKQTFSYNDWKKFTSKDGFFSVLLPTLPQHRATVKQIEDKPGSIRYDVYLSQMKNGMSFLINVIEYPEDMQGVRDAKILDTIINEMLSGKVKSVLEDKKEKLFLGHPSVDFLIKGDLFANRGKAFIVDQKVIVLSIVDYHLGEDEEGAFETFANSFKINKNT